MAKEQIFLLMEMSIWENIKKESLMGRDSIHGEMDKFILESLKMDLNMVRVNGKVEKDHSVIHMKEIM